MRRAADRQSVNKDIVLVEINDSTSRERSGVFGRWPWPRLAVSFLIDYLHRAPAKVVAMDFLLSEPDRVAKYDLEGDPWSGSQSDRALADSVKKSGNVIMLADAVYEGLTGAEKDTNATRWPDSGYTGERGAQRPLLLAPYQALSDASPTLGPHFRTRHAA